MNADNRANPPAGGTFNADAFRPTSATSEVRRPGVVPQAPQSGEQAPARPAGQVPRPVSTGQVPQRTSVRPGGSGQFPTTTTPTEAAPTSSSTHPVTQPRPAFGQPPFSGAQPTTGEAPAGPLGDKRDSGSGIGKIKGFALKAKDSLTEGDDLKASNKKGGPRKVRVLVSRVDPWSAMKLGFLLSIAAGIMLTVAVYVVWNVLYQMGVFNTVNDWILQLFTEDQELNLTQFFDQNRVMSATVLIAVVNVVLLTALSTIAAFLYNTVSSVVGGVYVTLTDD